MKTIRALGGLGGGVLLALLLLAACGGQDAIDVTAAKDEDVVPAGEETPSEPVADTPTAPAEDDSPAAADGGAPDAMRPRGAPRAGDPGSVNGWNRISPAADFQTIVTSRSGRSVLAASAGEGYLSIDGGATWAALDWPGERRSEVAVDPSGAAIVVAGFSPAAGEETSALRSSDSGFSWEETDLDAPAVRWFVLDSFLYGTSGRGVVASNDGGTTSTTLGSADQAWPANFDPVSIHTDPGKLDRFAVVSVSEGGSAAVRVTPDGGATFQPLASEFELWGVTVPVFSPIGPMIMSQGVGVLFSFDGGFTWSEQNLGLESLLADDLFQYQALIDFAFLPGRGLPVVATADAIYWFDPGGWNALPGPGAAIRALAVLGGESEQLLVATDSGVWAIATTTLTTRP